MQSRLRPILWLLAAAIMTGILIVSVWVKHMDCEHLLLVTPASSNSAEVSAEELEKINGNSFLLTYEIQSKENLQALNANYEVILKKTNYTHPFITGERFLTGSFFTEEDQKKEKKSAVLNKTAAYAMFGNINICGRTIKIMQDEFTITGIVDDKNKKENIVYIPASCSEQNPSSFVIKLEGDLTAGQAENKCKAVASEEGGYQFVSFGQLTGLIYGILFIGLKLGAMGLLLILIKRGHGRFRESIQRVRSLLDRFYAKDLWKYHRREALRAVMVLGVMILMVILILNFLFSFMEYYLLWHDNLSQLKVKDSSAFGEIASNLVMALHLSFFFLTGFFISVVLLMVIQQGKDTV